MTYNVDPVSQRTYNVDPVSQMTYNVEFFQKPGGFKE